MKLVNHPLVTTACERDAATDPERFRALTRITPCCLEPGAPRRPTVDGTEHPGRRRAADRALMSSGAVLRWRLGMVRGDGLIYNARRASRSSARRHRAVASRYYAEAAARQNSYVLLVDPMLATGGSAVSALGMLARPAAPHAEAHRRAPEGIAAVERRTERAIFAGRGSRTQCAQIIVPGLGFGDRLWNAVINSSVCARLSGRARLLRRGSVVRIHQRAPLTP